MVDVLADAPRVADDLLAMHEHGHPALAGQFLHLWSVPLQVGHAHLVVLDTRASQPSSHLSAGAEQVGGRLAAVEGRHDPRLARPTRSPSRSGAAMEGALGIA